MKCSYLSNKMEIKFKTQNKTKPQTNYFHITQLLTPSYTVPFPFSAKCNHVIKVPCPHRISKNKRLSYFHQWKINKRSLPQQTGQTWPSSESIFLIINNSQKEKSIKIILLLFNKWGKFPIQIKSVIFPCPK